MARQRHARAGGNRTARKQRRTAASRLSACAGMVVVLALAGCANLPAPEQAARSPCDLHEASWACQIQRYHDIAQ